MLVLQKVSMILLICVVFTSCSFFSGSGGKAAQEQTIENKLEAWNLGDVKQACDGCDFTMQEAISRDISKVDEERVSLSRAQSGVRVYLFDNYTLENAFLTLIDSNLFSTRINREYRLALLDAISADKSDFSLQGGVDKIGVNSLDKVEFTKRLKNTNEPKMILNSVNTMQTSRRDYRYSDSLEGYVVDKQVVILHFFSESQLWSR